MGRYLDIAESVLADRWARKAAALLSAVPDSIHRADLRDEFEERAGIAEFDGGLPRDEAERVAFEELLVRVK